MGGLVEALLGAGIGASTAAVNNAKHDQQQMDADAAEQRVMNRETALMYLRDKYAKGQAEHADSLARGRAKFENNLKLDSLNDKRVTQAEGRKRQDEIDDYDLKKKIDNDYASQKETRDNAEWGRRNGIEYSQQKGLVDMKLSDLKSRKGGGGDDGEIGDPDFVDARDSLTGYLGIENKDLSNPMLLNKKLGLPPDNKHGGEVLKAATLILGANPHLDPNEAVKYGNDILSGKIKLGTAPIGNGKRLQYFTANGRRFGYGRPD